MKQHERLAFLLQQIGIEYPCAVADYLLANGVIVPPCKIGDTVYIISDYTNEILDRLIIGIIIKKDGYGFVFETQSSWSDTDIGKTVFLTQEEAEKALAERSGE